MDHEQRIRVLRAILLASEERPLRRGDLVRMACSFGSHAHVTPAQVENVLDWPLFTWAADEAAEPWDWDAEGGRSGG